MRARRRLAPVVVAFITALLLAGCGGLNGTKPVRPGLEVGSGRAPELRIDYPGPAADEPKEDIVRGFLRAGAASGGAYESARRFLSPTASEAWDPDRTIVLLADDTAPTIEELDPATLRVSAHPAGTVDSRGRYTAAGPDERVTATISLATVTGQWRITELPEEFGRWIGAGDVSRLVQPYAVHYVSLSRRATVPDVRWFPQDRLATRLARAQLDGLPEHLTGAAVSAVPPGARLLGDAVPVEEGVASVNIISTPLAPGEPTRQDLWAQFVTTLTQDPSVTSVQLSVDGVAVDLRGVDGPVSSLSRIGFPATTPDTSDLNPVVRRGEDVTEFDPDLTAQERVRQTTPQPSEYPAVPAGYTHLALSADATELAAVDPGGEGLSRWKDGTRYEVPDTGVALGAPAYDRRGFLWFGGLGAGADRLRTVDTRADPADLEAAAALPVVADWLEGRRVVQARVAADGDRVVVLSTRPDGTGPRVDLAGVVRGEGARPERLSPPLALGLPFESARGLVWLDDRSVATIAAVAGGAARPTILTVGGSVQELSGVKDATEVATTGGERNLYVLTDESGLFARSGPRWVDSGSADDLASPAG